MPKHEMPRYEEANNQVVAFTRRVAYNEQNTSIVIHALCVTKPRHALHQVAEKYSKVLPVDILTSGIGAIDIERYLMEAHLDYFLAVMHELFVGYSLRTVA